MVGRIDASCLSPDKYERAARLGVAPDTTVPGESDALSIIRDALDIRYVLEELPIVRDGETLVINNIRISSTALAKAMDGCKKCYLLVATLGYGVDRLLLRMAGEGAYKHFLIDALADCMIEAALDEIVKTKCKEKLTNRFSPGYADLDLSVGREIVSLTSADKLIGISFASSGLMTPKKSVNCIIGIKEV